MDKGTRDKPEFYIRRGASTYPAQPGDLREAARSRPPAQAPGRMTPFGRRDRSARPRAESAPAVPHWRALTGLAHGEAHEIATSRY